MVLPNLAFDGLFFGLLLVAAVLDSAFPILHGAASLLIVGGATYWAAQELADALLRRAGWTQESLSTSVALCVGGFLYFWFRNSSDLALLVLSIGLMMGSLMAAISVLAAVSAAFKEGSSTPVTGWGATLISSFALGLAAGVLTIVMGLESQSVLPLKIGGIVVAVLLWKFREKMAPPSVNPHYQDAASQGVAAATATPLHAPRVALFPQRGTLLDRLFPLLVLGVLLMTLNHKSAKLDVPANAAVAPSDAGDAK